MACDTTISQISATSCRFYFCNTGPSMQIIYCDKVEVEHNIEFKTAPNDVICYSLLIDVVLRFRFY